MLSGGDDLHPHLWLGGDDWWGGGCWGDGEACACSRLGDGRLLVAVWQDYCFHVLVFPAKAKIYLKVPMDLLLVASSLVPWYSQAVTFFADKKCPL